MGRHALEVGHSIGVVQLLLEGAGKFLSLGFELANVAIARFHPLSQGLEHCISVALKIPALNTVSAALIIQGSDRLSEFVVGEGARCAVIIKALPLVLAVVLALTVAIAHLLPLLLKLAS
jgi:hypothetical protein